MKIDRGGDIGPSLNVKRNSLDLVVSCSNRFGPLTRLSSLSISILSFKNDGAFVDVRLIEVGTKEHIKEQK